MSDTILWYATRGAGVVSLILLTGVVVLGIVSAMRWQTAAWPRFLTTGLHRNLALATLVFLAIHIVTAVVDPFTALGWQAAVIPFSSSYRRLWLGLGVVRSEEHTSELQSHVNLVCRLLLEKKKRADPHLLRAVHIEPDLSV